MTVKTLPLPDTARETAHPREVSRPGWAYRRLSLAQRFLITGFVVVLAGTLVAGLWMSRQLERGVVGSTASITALYVDSVISQPLQGLARSPHLEPQALMSLERLVDDTALGDQIVDFKVWSLDGDVVYSREESEIGRRYPPHDNLQRAAQGAVATDIGALTDQENAYLKRLNQRLLEVYIPVREHGSGRIIGVTEFYLPTHTLDQRVSQVQQRAWVFISGLMLVMFGMLVGIVRQGSDTIRRQQSALSRQIERLTLSAQRNARLHQRVRLAGQRTIALNELSLRRVSSDIHDGPAQALSIALLRLDPEGDRVVDENKAAAFETIRGALTDLRAITAGLRSPEMADLDVAAIVRRVTRDHERRARVSITRQVLAPDSEPPIAVKIALFRTLQEALSNATRHGAGAGIDVRLWPEDGYLVLRVTDQGPGFTSGPEDSGTHLGLTGIRERAELLGGDMTLTAGSPRGTVLTVRWSPAEPSPDVLNEEQWP